MRLRIVFGLTLCCCLHLSFPETALAYIGPGAGFAFLGSTFVFILSIGLALLTILFWPLQWCFRKLFGKGISSEARARRVVILGLDGLEPKLTEKYMQEGKLPELKKLAELGSYSRLGTTLPALSPVAWSTFQTGVNPGAHNIFDFLTRDKRFCMPLMASTETNDESRKIGLGPLKFKIGGPKVRITRKSEPFWKILGRHGVFCNILRVPISYPAEPFKGNLLSAMCTPDLKGTQGSFSFFSSEHSSSGASTTGGERKALLLKDGAYHGELEGPPDPAGHGAFLKTPFSLKLNSSGEKVYLQLGEKTSGLTLNRFSEWQLLEFKLGKRKKVSGIARFCLRKSSPHLELYVTPININPDKPVLPIAAPLIFSSWLAKKTGLFGTLGLMEDTWGRNEQALDDARFLEQTYLTHQEREEMFMELLQRTPEGVCACVFDASDRIQHMFWRYMEDGHPSPCESADFKDTIPQMYERMDELVGRVRAKLNPKDLLIVLSDHGFASFRRGLNLNTWLWQNGYLALKTDKPSGADYLADVDWSKTKAYALGLSGLYLNIKGRESRGIVAEQEAASLLNEISAKLEQSKDPKTSEPAVSKVYQSRQSYRGLYVEEAPDLIVGYNPGYRVSWDSVTGIIEPQVFSDNLKAWSGDHHVDPAKIPGIFFSNRKLRAENPAIIDIAPTMLDLFRVPVPNYMEGQVII